MIHAAEDVVTIYCGLKNQEHAIKSKNFWPVLEAVENFFDINPSIFKSPYKLIFSSKTAIEFFYHKFFITHADVLNHCTGVYFVGQNSKHHFQKTFVHADLKLNYPSKNDGMLNTIKEFNLDKSEEKLIFVTGAEGKSKTVIESTDFKSKTFILPIYYLVPYAHHALPEILESLHFDAGKKFVFECRSGQILLQSAIFLMQYFSCNDILSLPKNIFFSCFGQSTFDKVNQLYEQHTSQRAY